VFDRAWENPESAAGRIIRFATIFLAGICLAGSLASIVGLARTSLLARPLRVSPEVAESLGPGLVLCVAGLGIVGVVALAAPVRKRLLPAFVAFACLPVLMGHLGLGPVEKVFEAKSARELAARMPALDAHTELVLWNTFPSGLPFYLNRTATLVTL